MNNKQALPAIAYSLPQTGLLLTHWDREIYRPPHRMSWLTELVLYALMYEEVLVRDTDVILTPHISERLAKSTDDFDVFSELLSTGCVKFLTPHPNAYKKNQGNDPYNAPVTARIERHSKERSLAGRRFEPTPWQWALCARLDSILKPESNKPPRGVRYLRKFPPENKFASRMEKTLAAPGDYPLKGWPQFQSIDRATADTLLGFCRDEHSWEKFLRDKGAKEIVGEGEGFYRPAAYQCAEYLPLAARQGIKNLLQSVNAWCECEREDVEGRYGGRLLWEIPYPSSSGEDSREAMLEAEYVQVVPSRKAQPFETRIRPGIGQVLASTRESTQFKEFRETWAALETPVMNERVFWRAFEHLADRFAENAARQMVHVTETETRIWHWAPVALTAANEIAGFAFGHKPLPSTGSPLQDTAAQETISFVGKNLSRFIRSAVFAQRAREELIRAVKVRCSKAV